MLNLDLIIQPWGAFEGFESGHWSRVFALIECRGWTEEARDWNDWPTAAVQVIEDIGLKWGRDTGVETRGRCRKQWKVLQNSVWKELGRARTEMVMCLNL